MAKPGFERSIVKEIIKSLKSKKKLINIIVGPRQVGKTTAALDIKKKWQGPVFYANADLAANWGIAWIIAQWNLIRNLPAKKGKPRLLILDEIQKISGWSDVVKGLWDEDQRERHNISVLLLGSSALLLSRGFAESLAGRFILHRFTHWSLLECKEAFGWDLNKWIFFGGYPGAAFFTNDIPKWKQYINDSLIDTVLTKDVLALQAVNKPALLRNLFILSTRYPAQILSYNKMLGQMHDAGNTTTLTHYLKILETAFLITGLEKHSGSEIKIKSSSPKLILWNNALISALDTRDFDTARNDLSWWGRLLENAVGAHLVNNLQSINYNTRYWRERNSEVDFIVTSGQKTWAIEVKSGLPGKLNGLEAFIRKYPNSIPVIIGPGGIKFSDFFNYNLIDFFK